MSNNDDLYGLLGLDKGASESDIKKAYRKKVKECHPDVGGDEELFKKVSYAYEVLSDPQKKSNYDQFGSPDGGQNFGNMNDIFSQFFGGNPFGGNRNQVRKPKGRDLKIKVNLTLEDIHNGVSKKFKYKHLKKCGTCNGDGGDTKTCDKCRGNGVVVDILSTPFGRMQQQVMCDKCSGSGKMVTNVCKECNGKGGKIHDDTFDITIPKGVHDGQMIVKREGGDFIKGGVSGDLILQIVEIPHERFIRNGDDLIHRLKIPYHTLVLGGPMEVKTIDGKIKLNIKEGTEIGENLRVPGKGLYSNGPHRGDLIIETWLDVPKKITDEQRNAIEKLKNSDYSYEELK